MTTKAAEAPPQPKELGISNVPLDRIQVAGNARKKFDEAGLRELGGSIRLNGLINPIVLRPNGKPGYFFLVAGERRYRAAKLVGLPSLTASVREMTEQQALEIQAAENIQRQDLTPVEEARAFETLTKSGKWSVEDLAKRVDKSVRYVYRALRLLDLPKKVVELIDSGELTAPHGHQLLRVSPEEREAQFRKWLGSWEYRQGRRGARDLADHIDSALGHELSEAAFPKDRPYAGAVACSACPLNSANQGMLFDGAEKGTCSGPKCFESKQAQHAADELAGAKAKYGKDFAGRTDHYVSVGSRAGGGVVVGKAGTKQAETLKDKKVVLDEQGQAWVATNDKGAIRKAVGHSAGGGQTKVKTRPPKVCFVERWTDKQLFRKMLAEAKPLHMAEQLLKEECGGWFNQKQKERLAQAGFSSAEGAAKGAAATVDLAVQRLYLLLASKITAYDLCDAWAQAAGVDVAAFKKASKAAAERAWDERKKK